MWAITQWCRVGDNVLVMWDMKCVMMGMSVMTCHRCVCMCVCVCVCVCVRVCVCVGLPPQSASPSLRSPGCRSSQTRAACDAAPLAIALDPLRARERSDLAWLRPGVRTIAFISERVCVCVCVCGCAWVGWGGCVGAPPHPRFRALRTGPQEHTSARPPTRPHAHRCPTDRPPYLTTRPPEFRVCTNAQQPYLCNLFVQPHSISLQRVAHQLRVKLSSTRVELRELGFEPIDVGSVSFVFFHHTRIRG
jgi:hypothetical protein